MRFTIIFLLFISSVFSITEHDVYSDPLKYMEEPLPYRVKIIFGDGAKLTLKVNSFREVIRASSYYYRDDMKFYYKPDTDGYKYRLLINEFGTE